MQKGKEKTTMLPKNPIASDPETEVPLLQSESMETAREPELEKPFSSETTKDPKGSKKSKSEEESVHKSPERVVAAWKDSSSLPKKGCVEEGTSSTTAPTKSEGTVEDNSSGRERLKRHRVEVAGRVWIPEMWGQENLLKDWVDCTAFDATLAKSGIMSARASLMEEGRRANSTRFRIENSC
ncbi:hypothetical protein Pfo_004134 [Paulownia fortunei]|nr:hypothetical protein Pfo_004134 [Paulownia fortunei]